MSASVGPQTSASEESASKVSGLLKEPLSAALVEGVMKPRLKRTFADALTWFPAINRAHLVMLTEQGLIESTVAARLLTHIDELENEGIAAFELDPEREDTWFNYEAELIRRAGPDAGRLHLARSRNDLKATVDRMRLMKLAQGLLRGCLAIRRDLLSKAQQEAGTVMPGYTHLQHAQPITFGWYLLGIEAALSRDAERIEDLLKRADQCPLGAGAFAGTRFPIDRDRTARLLGFSRPQPHPMDAVANQDAVVELISAATQMAMTIGRLSQDFYIWSTYEFAMLDFPDRLASTSSMMPQKRNLTVLENLKSRPAVLIGAMTTAVAACRAVPFGHSHEIGVEMGRWLWDGVEEFISMLPAVSEIVTGAIPQRDRMKALAGENFATATALADLLSLRYGLPFREAHHVTGRYIRSVMEGASPETALRTAFASQPDANSIDADEILAETMDPERILEAETGCGPSRVETGKLIELSRSRLANAERTVTAWHQRTVNASELLAAACDNLKAESWPVGRTSRTWQEPQAQ